jgi:hypothetical protein
MGRGHRIPLQGMRAATVRNATGNRAGGCPSARAGRAAISAGLRRGTFYAAADIALSAVTWGAVVHVLGSTDTPFQIHLVNSSRSRSSGVKLRDGDRPEDAHPGPNRAAVIRATARRRSSLP